jgi:polysaccharide chain length determinant protein (PEP-CTERM system associated)
MEEQVVLSVHDFVEIVKRRRWSLIVPALIIFFIAAAVCVVLDPVYRSTATILIEDQDISRDYVVSTGTSLVEQRLQAINQKIMSSGTLLEVINKFNLYADERGRLTMEEIIDRMRNKYIKFSPVTSDVVDSRTGRPSVATIAFTVSYEGKNPVVVQQVTDVLTSLYLEENIKFKQQQSASTTKFLQDEVNDVQGRLEELEKKIAVYKGKHAISLPERYQFNLQTLDRAERDADQLKDLLRALQEKESSLQSQLASIPPLFNPDTERLRVLRQNLVSLRTRVSDEYPDVIKLKAEIAELEQRIGAAGGPAADKTPPDNPVYITLTAQLASAHSEIESVKRQLADLNNKKREYSQRLENSPKVEEGYKNLLVERNNTQAKYDDLMKKFMEARTASGLEKEQMGQRLTLLNPAELPEKPVKPNRLAIMLIGIILGIGSGVGVASLREYSDDSVRNAESLVRATGYGVLAMIPEITLTKPEDIAMMRKKRLLVLAAIALIIVAGVVLFHFFIMDLDVFWARLSRRLAI